MRIRKTTLILTVLISILSLMALAACAGESGNPGNPGQPGKAGDPGKPGLPGLQGLTGDPGAPGKPGQPGLAGLQGSAGDPGLPGNPGLPGLSGAPGKPGLPGLPGSPGKPGLQGIAGIAPHANVMTGATTIYLDGSVEVWGSGFGKYEPVTVYIDVDTGVASVPLGSIPSDAGGAWRLNVLTFTVPAEAAQMVADRIEASGVFSVIAEGEDGTKASTPVLIRTTLPTRAVTLPFPGSILVGSMDAFGNFTAGIAAVGQEVTVIGGGFDSGVLVKIFLDGNVFQIVRTDENGSFSRTWPATLTAGGHGFQFPDTADEIAGSFTLLVTE